MKQSTQLILLSLYQAESVAKLQRTPASIRILVPELSESGYRSLLHMLEQRGWVYREVVFGEVRYSLTNLGERALRAQFPALSDRFAQWNGSWLCITFLQPPKGDSGFRFLRSLLLSEGAVSISRGTYLVPSCMSERLQQALTDTYDRSVLAFAVGEWQHGTERPIVVKTLGLTDSAENYSGIGTEVKLLLSSLRARGGLSNQQKLKIRNSWVRFCVTLQEDPGFTHWYFPETPGIQSLLRNLHTLLTL